MKYKSLVLILATALISGCAAVVVAGAAVGMAGYDRRTVVTMEKDARIFHVIHKAIVSDPRFRDSRIEVSSFNRVVLLTGQTPAASLRVLAEKIAQTTPNVYRVYNEITVGYPLALSLRPRDGWVTGQVRSRLLATKGLESGSIRIVTENGVVYLMGIVTPEQSTLAVETARQTRGVRKVVKVFQYIR